MINDNNGSYSGNISGAGTLDVTAVKGTAASNANLVSLGGNMDNFTGTLNMQAWPTAATPAYSCDWSPNGTINTTATINIGDFGATLMNRAGGTYTVGMILGGQNSVLAGNQTSGTNPTTWVVGGSNASGNFDGAITNSNNPTSIVKEGTGTWTLTGLSSTYTGTTTVNNGVLNLDGAALNCATYTVNNGGTLNVALNGVNFTGNAPVIQLASGGALDVSSQFDYSIPSNMTIAGTGGTVWGETNARRRDALAGNCRCAYHRHHQLPRHPPCAGRGDFDGPQYEFSRRWWH